MKFPRILLLCMALLATLWLGAARAVPNVDEVQAAVQRGDHAGAEKMMREVVAARPDSARAHYVLAELLARRSEFKQAAEHAARARTLDPALRFTDAAKFNAFEQALQRQQAGAGQAAVPAALEPAPAPQATPVERVERAGSFNGVPVWLWMAGGILLIGIFARLMRRRAVAPVEPALAGGSPGPGGFMSHGAGLPAGRAGGGPGLMGVGLAAAGGVAAGMLAERMLHDGPDGRGLPQDSSAGGIIPGSFDGGMGSAADDLIRRGIDFGGGDGWDAGGGDVGGGGGGDDW